MILQTATIKQKIEYSFHRLLNFEIDCQGVEYKEEYANHRFLCALELKEILKEK